MLRRGNSYIIFLVGALIISGLLFSCSDGGPSDPGLNGNGDNGTGPENSPVVVTVDVPEQYRHSDPPEHSFSVEDQDGFSEGIITYSENDSTIWEKSLEGFSATQWDTAWTPAPEQYGEALLKYTIRDDFDGEKETRTGSAEIVILPPGNAPGSIEAEYSSFTAQMESQIRFEISDPDTLLEITFNETDPAGSTTSFTVQPMATHFDTTISRTYASTGEAVWTVTASDKHSEPETFSEEYKIPIHEQPLKTYTMEGTVTNPVLKIPAEGVSVRLYSPDGSKLDEAETDGQGAVSLSHEQPEDEPVDGFRIEMQASGYLDAEETVNLGQESFSVELEPSPIEFSAATEEIDPRGSILIDLNDLVNTGGVPLAEINIEQTSSSLSAVQENGTKYRLSVENDVAATTESITIRARTATNDQNSQVEVPIGERAFISITQSQFEVTEDDTLALNLANYVNSGADIDSLHISTSSTQLEIIRDGSGLYRLIPENDFYGDLQVELYASNLHGSETTQSGLLQVERLPRVTVRVENNETDEHTSGLTAHLGVYDSSGAITDSLTSSDGVFEIKLREEGEIKLLARYTRNGDAFSYLRTDWIENTGADQEHLIRVIDFYIRELNGSIIDELREGEPGIANPEGFRKMAVKILDGVQRWNNEFISSTEQGTFNYYTQSKNQRGPEKLLVAEIFHREDNGQTSYLTDRVKRIMIDVYENDIAQWMGEFAPEIEFVDSLAFNYLDNQHKNLALFIPNSHPAPGEAGSVLVYGEAPNNIYNAQAWIRNDGKGKDDQITRATSQEAVNGFGLNSVGSSHPWAEHYQSVVHNFTSLTRPSLLDGKLMRAVWETTYGSPVRDPDDILMLEDVFGKPDY